MPDKLLKTHVFCFNPQDNGGEGLTLVTKYFDNGDGGIYTNQELCLQSYCNQASISLCGAALTPDLLRKLANELDEARIDALSGLQQTKVA